MYFNFLEGSVIISRADFSLLSDWMVPFVPFTTQRRASFAFLPSPFL